MDNKKVSAVPTTAKLAKKYTILVLLLATVALFFLIWTKPVNRAELKPLPVLKVAVGKAQQQVVQPIEMVSGTLQPAHKSALRFEVAGQATQRHVEPGQKVQKGQVLLTLARDDFMDAAAEARAQFEQERAAVKRDKKLQSFIEKNRKLQAKEVQRLVQLGQGSMTSKSRLDTARQQLLRLQAEEEHLKFSVATAQARLTMKESKLRRAERNLSRTQLISPFDAVVNTVTVNEGDYVAAKQVVVELIQNSESDLYLEVRGRVVSALHLGQSVAVILGERPYRADVIALQQNPDPVTFTHAVRLRIKVAQLLPGTVGYAQLPLTVLDAAITVPVSAVLYDGETAYVFRVEQNHVVRTVVKLGIRVDDVQVIHSGLLADERIVIRDVVILADGQMIQTDDLNKPSILQ